MVKTSVTDREKRLMAMGQMAASLAHEIRNPLGSMELYCSMLRRDLIEQPSNLKLVDNILKGIRNLERVVANSLQFARDMRIARREIESKQAYLEEILDYVKPIAHERGVFVELMADPEKTLVADPSQLQQVLINILLNAIDAASLAHHSGERDELPTLAPLATESFEKRGLAGVRLISQVLETGDWQIQVVDNGIGISTESLERVFDPFFSTKSNGTGLGMSVAYSIVKAHGGELTIDSEINRGTTVTVLLPASYD